MNRPLLRFATAIGCVALVGCSAPRSGRWYVRPVPGAASASQVRALRMAARQPAPVRATPRPETAPGLNLPKRKRPTPNLAPVARAKKAVQGEAPAATPSVGTRLAPAAPMSALAAATLAAATPAAPTVDVPQEGLTTGQGGKITLHVKDTSIADVLKLLSIRRRVNIAVAGDLSGNVTVSLYDVSLEEALDAILTVNGYTWALKGNVVYVTNAQSEAALPLETQARQTRIFRLNYADVTKTHETVSALLSRVGKAFFTEAQTGDNRLSEDLLIVEDLPAYLDRVALVVKELDRRPRQVMIRARIFEITLKDEYNIGVHWDVSGWAADVAHAGVSPKAAATLLTQNFATLSSASNATGMFFTLSSREVSAYMSALQQVAKLKTLATPHLLALDGEMARIQVGSQLGYRTTTTTETSTQETVEFLDIGTMLEVEPSIADDGNIVLLVKPEVSDGQVDSNTGLPSENTSQAETSLVVQDGKTVVIGGLISERDEVRRSQVPILGDIPLLGWLFRRNETQKISREIIVTLTPQIVPDSFGTSRTAPSMTKAVATVDEAFPSPMVKKKRSPWTTLDALK